MTNAKEPPQQVSLQIVLKGINILRLCQPNIIITTFPKELEWRGPIDGETSRSRRRENLAIRIETGIKYMYGAGRGNRMASQIHVKGARGEGRVMEAQRYFMSVCSKFGQY